MNITFNPTDKQQRAIAKRAGALSAEDFLTIVLGEQADRWAADDESKLLALMQPVGAEIASAAGGDPAKITLALEAGKTAALAALQP